MGPGEGERGCRMAKAGAKVPAWAADRGKVRGGDRAKALGWVAVRVKGVVRDKGRGKDKGLALGCGADRVKARGLGWAADRAEARAKVKDLGTTEGTGTMPTTTTRTIRDKGAEITARTPPTTTMAWMTTKTEVEKVRREGDGNPEY
ncbi:MAG: hypothetical protein AB1696_20130 [Planctomycetota bacterium]